jgi:carbamoyl-phosphate synthase small subunit
MRGGVFPARMSEGEARELIAAEEPMAGLDLAREVTPAEATVHGAGGGLKVHAIDTGIKSSIVRNLVARGAEVTLHPCSITSEELLATDADAFFLANGPGDPAALGHIVETVRALVGAAAGAAGGRPVWGICLGHQLLCQAVGLETYKLPFGHRGANHPVKDLTTGKIEITSQNHGFAVQGPSGAVRLDTGEPVRWETDFGAAELTHVNLYDGTVEGLTLLDVPASTVQYHPEAGPGPHDSLYLFDRFVESVGQSLTDRQGRLEADLRSQDAGQDAPRGQGRPEADLRSQDAGQDAPRGQGRPEADLRSQDAGQDAPRR